RAVETSGIARPSAMAEGNTGGGRGGGFYSFRCRDQPKPVELPGARHTPRLGRMECYARKLGRVFVLEIETSGDARCAARGRIGAGAFSQPPGKVFVLHPGQRRPCLKISGGGFQHEKYRRREFRKLPGLEVVKLNEDAGRAVRTHDHVASARGGG